MQLESKDHSFTRQCVHWSMRILLLGTGQTCKAGAMKASNCILSVCNAPKGFGGINHGKVDALVDTVVNMRVGHESIPTGSDNESDSLTSGTECK